MSTRFDCVKIVYNWKFLTKLQGQVHMILHILNVLSSVSDVVFICVLLLEPVLPKVSV
jgi:hypothetical protein